MSFERVDTKNTHSSEPVLTISPNTSGAYLHEGALREFFDGVEHVTILVDRDRSLLAFEPGDGEDAYTVSRRSEGGAQLALKQALSRLDVGVNDLEKTHRCGIYQDDESGYVVADVSTVVEDATSDVHCPECEKRFAESGLKQHLSMTHDENNPQKLLKEADPDTIGDKAPEGDDSWREKYQEGEA